MCRPSSSRRTPARSEDRARFPFSPNGKPPPLARRGLTLPKIAGDHEGPGVPVLLVRVRRRGRGVRRVGGGGAAVGVAGLLLDHVGFFVQGRFSGFGRSSSGLFFQGVGLHFSLLVGLAFAGGDAGQSEDGGGGDDQFTHEDILPEWNLDNSAAPLRFTGA